MSGLRNTITFVVTEECNLRCSYCYMVHKNNRARMSIETARRAVDYVLTRRDLYPSDDVVWEFIGGEPLLEIDLIGQIVDYALQRSYDLEHPWFAQHMFSISSNGVLYQSPKVQALVRRLGSHLNVGVTIDGPAAMHDMCRRFPDGTGSHAVVEQSARLWIEQFGAAALRPKVTFSHETLPLLKDSILWLFDFGFPNLACNVVYENVWQPGDAELFEAQLDDLGDEMISRGIAESHSCRFFDRRIGRPMPDSENRNWCGAGRYMLAVDARGAFYPCVRFMGFSLAKQPPLSIGSLEAGIDAAALEPFRALTRTEQGPAKCLTCEVASGCSWCAGFNYDDTGAMNRRATHICEMHKARCRANDRFWAKAGVASE